MVRPPPLPRHERTKVIDGIPEGWERQHIAELCLSVDYGYTASADREDVGPKFLRITDIVPDFIDWSSVPHCVIEDSRFTKFRLCEVICHRAHGRDGWLREADQQAASDIRLRILFGEAPLEAECGQSMVGFSSSPMTTRLMSGHASVGPLNRMPMRKSWRSRNSCPSKSYSARVP